MDKNEKISIYEKLCCAGKAAYVEIVKQMPVPQIAKDRLIEIG